MKRLVALVFVAILITSCFCSFACASPRRYTSSSSSSGNEIFDWFIGILVGFIVLCVICGIVSVCRTDRSKFSSWSFSSRMSTAEKEFAEQAHRISNKGIDANTSKKAEEALVEYEAAYSNAKSQTRLVSDHIYQEDLEDIHDNYQTLCREEWERRAGKILDRFIELYLMINDPTFKDVEKAYRSKKKCIEYWQKYYASLPDGVIVHPKQYIKDYLMDDYDICMESHELLDKKLSSCIEHMKPEYKRAVKLRKDLLDMVAQNESMMRSELLSKTFDGCTKKEIEWCYRELVKQYKLVEIKMNNRYIVKLSDKESEKRNK